MAVAMQEYHLLIDGKNVPAATGETFETVSPTTNEVIGRVAKAGLEDVERGGCGRPARRSMTDPGRAGRRRSGRGRLNRVSRASCAIGSMRFRGSRQCNCGKIIVESRGDVNASANCFEYYGNLATQIWGEQIPMNGPLLDYTCASQSEFARRSCPGTFRC